MNKQLVPGDVQKGDIVKVYFTLMQHMYGGEPDVLQVSHVSADEFNCEAMIMPLRCPIPFNLTDIIAVYRREERTDDYRLIWWDKKHEEDI